MTRLLLRRHSLIKMRTERVDRRKTMADTGQVFADTDKTTTDDALLEEKLSKIGIGGSGPTMVVDGMDPSKPPLAAVAGRDGVLRDPDTGEAYGSNYITVTAYKNMQEALAEGAGGADTDEFRARQTALIQVANAQKGLGKMRQRAASVGDLARVTSAIVTDLSSLEAQGIPAESAIGLPNTVVTLADKVTKSVTGIKGAFLATNGMVGNSNISRRSAVELGRIEDVNKIENQSILDEYSNEFDAIQVPPELAEIAGVYKARIVRMAYAVARAQEPGARQLSDADFRHALEGLGRKFG